ncbi:MAG: deoxyribonuclease IV [Candidatus Dadabacteria bacterium]|nr:deoxyribonuclease IV [Candidatus Dadabacteria bacterium]NIV42165.1 deoxyribonuclease IV [Candidatus Dadabacteria bacterium]NIX16504.1 deoxyribonuclease IV [Candidatus Dadabacteria bacterium]
MKFGAHVSIAGGIFKAPERASSYGCECFQIFTRSPRGGNPPKLDKETVDKFLNKSAEYNLSDYYVHTPYYINFASENKDIRKSSTRIVAEELQRADIINAKYIMTHLGSSKGIERKVAISRVADAAKEILDKTNTKTRLLLENSAGQGETIGEKFEELAEILDQVNNPELGICIDTAHTFAAGYDIRNKKALNQVLKEFDGIVGIEKIWLIHGNDSKIGLGEKKDRHEHIGLGEIGTEGFESVVNNNHLKSLDMIVETPPENVASDIEILKKMRK